MTFPRRARTLAILLTTTGCAGCSIAPKSFRQMNHPASIMRARAVGLADGLPTEQSIPTLIEHLRDPDPVVRMAASEELKRQTGQSLGFIPWGTEPEREEAVNRWRSWWNARQGQTSSRPAR
ncbi:MAG: HEAT repeat domain-containing protein [Isosphaeraceae bacterium]